LRGTRLHELTTITGLPGTGKCEKRGTKILMFDGSVKNIEDIKVGNKVLGIDGNCREVLNIHHGFDDMFEVTQTKGKNYTVNSQHILSLKSCENCEIYNISVTDYLQLNRNTKNKLKGWKPGIMNFPHSQPVLNPYAFGYNLIRNKKNHIPLKYKFASIEDRKQLISGLLQSSKYITNTGEYKLYFESLSLCKDVVFVVRSLGLYAYIEDEQYLFISCVTDILNLLSSIDVKYVGYGEYFGIEVSGDHYYLHEDFTVIHNSSFAFEEVYQFAEQGHKVGLIMLEDPIIETQHRIAARYCHVNLCDYDENPLKAVGGDKNKLREAWEYSINPDRFMVLHHFGSIASKSLISKVKSLTASGCQILLIDHASMSVSGLETTDERKDLDILYTALSAFVAAHPVHIKIVCHVDKKAGTQDNKRPSEPKWQYINPNNLRGTAGIFQLSCNVIVLHSELLPDGSRGRVMIGVAKNRRARKLGDADIVRMDDKTGLWYDASGEVWTPKDGGY
jgi:hypothetical protein